ncbi:MAG TPA: hypothetical protein VGM07_06170 [Stellaceae bacterium]|jgi:hypothetical protein
MTTLRQIFAGAFRDAVLLAEEQDRARRWEGVHAVAQRVASRGNGDYGWGRALRAVVDPAAAAEPAPIVGARIARGWDIALAAFAPGAGEPATAAYLRGSTAASWDRALKDFTPAR